jgi:hypothetical protein
MINQARDQIRMLGHIGTVIPNKAALAAMAGKRRVDSFCLQASYLKLTLEPLTQ